MNFSKYLIPLILKNRLTEMTYYVTNLCNFACKHCFVNHELNKKLNQLSIDEIRKTGQHLPAMQRISISGGEPFIRKDIAELFVTLSNEWNAGVITVPTNGYYGDRIIQTIQEFGKNCNKNLRILFSLNSPYEKDFDEFTQTKGTFQKWKNNVSSARKIAQKYSNIKIGVLSSFNDFNQNIFEDLMNFVINDIGIDDFSFGLVRMHGDYHPKLNLEKYEKTIKDYSKKNKDNYLLKAYRELYRENLVSYYKNPRMIVPCYSGKSRVVLSPDGNVYPCETLGYPSGINKAEWLIGNIRDYNYDITALLKSSKADELHQKIKQTRCHCQDGCDLSLNLMLNHRFKIQVIKRAIRMQMHPVNCYSYFL